MAVRVQSRHIHSRFSSPKGKVVTSTGTEGAGVTRIDGPSVGVAGRSLRDQLDLPLRLLLAFFVGVGTVYLLEYMDTSVRSLRDLEALGLPWLGSIPKRRGRTK